jgi:hypothetical protein
MYRDIYTAPLSALRARNTINTSFFAPPFVVPFLIATGLANHPRLLSDDSEPFSPPPFGLSLGHSRAAKPFPRARAAFSLCVSGLKPHSPPPPSPSAAACSAVCCFGSSPLPPPPCVSPKPGAPALYKRARGEEGGTSRGRDTFIQT